MAAEAEAMRAVAATAAAAVGVVDEATVMDKEAAVAVAVVVDVASMVVAATADHTMASRPYMTPHTSARAARSVLAYRCTQPIPDGTGYPASLDN